MKKLMYTVALVVMAITSSYAQKPGKEKQTAEQRAENHANELEKKLTLTADQKQKIQKIELDRIKKNDEWREKDGKAMKGKMEERKAFMKANQDKVDAILTADQKQTLAASREEMKDKFKERRGDKGPRGPRGQRGPKGDKTPPPTPPVNN